MNNNKIKSCIYFLCLAIYYLVLILLICLDAFVYLFGGYYVVFFRYTALPIYMVIVLLVLAIAPIVTLFKFKTKRYVVLAALVIIMFSYFEITEYCCAESREYYSTFSAEEWQNYPVVRQEMYKALINENLVIGKNVNEVEDLLGEPDYKSENVLVYTTKPGRIQIKVQDNIAVHITYYSPLV